MARSTCPKCDCQSFEMVENSPEGSNFKIMFIQCKQCGTVVGVTDFYNIGEQTRFIREGLRKIAEKLNIFPWP